MIARLRRRGRRRGRCVIACIRQLLVVLARNRQQLVALAALRDLDPVLVRPLLDLAVAPGIEHLVAEALLGGRGRRAHVLEGLARVERGDAGVAADGGDELVALAALRDGDAAFVEPGLELAVGPAVPEPVAGVGGGFGEGVGGRLVVFAGLLDEDVAVGGLRYGDGVFVAEGFELGVGPAAGLVLVRGSERGMWLGVVDFYVPVEDPVTGVSICIICRGFGVRPGGFYLVDERVLVLGGVALDCLALGFHLLLQAGYIPVDVWGFYCSLPI